MLIDTSEMDPVELRSVALQMAADLKDWLDKYEPYYSNRYIVKAIKQLYADLVKQLDIEEKFLN